MGREFAQPLIRLSSLHRVLQNNSAPIAVHNPPFFDLLQGSKAAEACKVVVEAAISYARRLGGVVIFTHACRFQWRGFVRHLKSV
jgi:hypothetical protein